MGAARMGSSREDSVCDSDGETWDAGPASPEAVSCGFTRLQKRDALRARRLLLVAINDEIRHEGGCCSPGNATLCCGPCSSALGPPDHADRGDRAQVLDQNPVDGESPLA